MPEPEEVLRHASQRYDDRSQEALALPPDDASRPQLQHSVRHPRSWRPRLWRLVWQNVQCDAVRPSRSLQRRREAETSMPLVLMRPCEERRTNCMMLDRRNFADPLRAMDTPNVRMPSRRPDGLCSEHPPATASPSRGAATAEQPTRGGEEDVAPAPARRTLPAQHGAQPRGLAWPHGASVPPAEEAL